MSNPIPQQSPALRMEAGSCFFISWKKHDHSESLTAVYIEYLLLMHLMLFIRFIRRTPRKQIDTAGGDKHTLYFKGLHGDIFSQMTRNDTQLITDASSSSKSSNSLDVAKSPDLFELVGLSGVFPFAKGDAFPPNFFVKGFFCEDIAGSCSH